METYKKIIEVLLAVYSGKNLKEELVNVGNNPYLAKIKNHCFGILRNFYTLDFIIRNLIKHPVNDKRLNIILQIAIFEIKHSNKPVHAITNDLVELTKEIYVNKKIAAFVNAIARNFIRNKDQLEESLEKDYSLKYNLPNWFIDKLKKQYKINYKQILDGFAYHPGFGLRVNSKKIVLEKYLVSLEECGLEYGITDGKLYLKKSCDVNSLPLFKDGVVSVQDIAAQYTVNILQKNNVQPKKVLDACAAPGGKACQILENYSVNLTAVDCSLSRLDKIRQNLQRLELSCETIVADAASDIWWDKNKFDLIIADVPCSATGTIKRNPDIKVNRKEADIQNFVETQRKIAINLSQMLENNGYLLYITCSIFKDENRENVDWLISQIPGLTLIDELQILPSETSDSLYYALLQINNKR